MKTTGLKNSSLGKENNLVFQWINCCKTDASRRVIDLVPQIIPHLTRSTGEHFVLGGEKPLSYTQTHKMCERIQQDITFEETITPRRFRTTVLTDLYDMTKDIKQAQSAAGHTTVAMTLDVIVVMVNLTVLVPVEHSLVSFRRSALLDHYITFTS